MGGEELILGVSRERARFIKEISKALDTCFCAEYVGWDDVQFFVSQEVSVVVVQWALGEDVKPRLVFLPAGAGSLFRDVEFAVVFSDVGVSKAGLH